MSLQDLSKEGADKKNAKKGSVQIKVSIGQMPLKFYINIAFTRLYHVF